jgi:hypothetical protein
MLVYITCTAVTITEGIRGLTGVVPAGKVVRATVVLVVDQINSM